LQISSLTVARQRGILTRFPIPHPGDEDARTKEIGKEQNSMVEENLLTNGAEVNQRFSAEPLSLALAPANFADDKIQRGC